MAYTYTPLQNVCTMLDSWDTIGKFAPQKLYLRGLLVYDEPFPFVSCFTFSVSILVRSIVNGLVKPIVIVLSVTIGIVTLTFLLDCFGYFTQGFNFFSFPRTRQSIALLAQFVFIILHSPS